MSEINNFQVLFLSLTESPQEKTVLALTVNQLGNSFQILPNHAPLVSVLQPGATISLTTTAGQEEIRKEKAGILKVQNNKVIILESL